MIYVLSAQIVPIPTGGAATVELRPISTAEAKTILVDGFVSAVGHAGTAEAMTAVLGMEIPKQRLEVFLEPGDEAIQFVLRRRQPEGVVLDRATVETIGFYLVHVHRVK